MKIFNRKGKTHAMRVSPKWGDQNNRHKQRGSIYHEKIHVTDPRWPEYFHLVKERQQIDIDRREGYITTWFYRKGTKQINEKIARLLQGG